jgi:hypothetical protein
MGAPAWLDELPLEPGPPWLAMGTRHLELTDWLLVDEDRDRDLVRKAVLLEERHAEVFGALDTPAVGAASLEVLELVLAATGQAVVPPGLHPLDAAGRLVQEDLCLLVLRDGAPHLDAASLCFPSYWRLADKIGRPLGDVHAPVAHYADELSAKVDAFLARLRPDRRGSLPSVRRRARHRRENRYAVLPERHRRHASRPAGLRFRQAASRCRLAG